MVIRLKNLRLVILYEQRHLRIRKGTKLKKKYTKTKKREREHGDKKKDRDREGVVYIHLYSCYRVHVPLFILFFLSIFT